CPDLYRRHLFGMKNLEYTDDLPKMARITKTASIYWTNTNYLINNFSAALVRLCKNDDNIVKHIENNEEQPQYIKRWYRMVYNMADIAIVMARESNSCSILYKLLKIALDIKGSYPARFRLVMYLSYY